MAVKVGSSYEWVRGDYSGNIEEVKDITKDFILFKSGKRCSIDVFSEYLLPANSVAKTNNVQGKPRQNSGFSGVTTVQFSQDDENNRGVIPIDNTPIINDATTENDFTDNFVDTYKPGAVKPAVKASPITLLINQAAKDECELSIVYKVKIPKKSLYMMLKENFEDLDVEDEILETIINEMSTGEIINHFKKEIKDKIKIHYKQ